MADRTDEEIAAEEIGGDDLAVIASDDWRRIVRIPGLPSLILDWAERGGLVAINELLARHGAGQAQLPAMLRYLELSPDTPTDGRVTVCAWGYRGFSLRL